ncbi:hypothetical protein [Pseudobutyrivibrio xylanivorans]|uniref:Uncharacterized protein n=1 Tax=Pseudobutyrivibrio xylanivorans TaxID=185007 RepID=A0A5P6VW77_PSEXY|nr:hypothetical protein [Pseudobutyrivibrio xylanivorans]QFJ56111.1 hypothetical protein FXF36_15070 [Pseudobutyrivibrio xylanivorans]
MIQEKYNRRIFDEGTIDAIENLSHLRSNVLSPVGIGKDDNVLILEPDCTSIVEWLQETASQVTVAGSGTIEEVKGTFNIIINLGHMIETPSALKKLLSTDGRLVYALAEKDRLAAFVKKLLLEAGFEDITTFRVSPDYLFTREIYSEDYIGGGAGDYLLIAK